MGQMLAVFIIIIIIIFYYYCFYYIVIIFVLPELILRIAGKIANIRTRKNVVPLGSLVMLLLLTVKRNII